MASDDRQPETEDRQDAPGSLAMRVRELSAALQAANTEIELLKRSRHSVAHEFLHFRELFDFAPVPFLVLNRAGIIRQANLSAAALLGARPAKLEGRPLHAFVLREFARPLLDHLHQCRVGEAAARTEVELPARAGGEPLPVEIYTQCRGEDAESLYTTLIDLSDRRQAEEAHRHACEAEAIAEAKDEFLATISHELRAPLSPIANLIEVLRLRQDVPEGVTPILDMMSRNLWMEVRLINDLLDAMRIRGNKLTLLPETLDLHQVLHNVADMLSDDFAKEEIVLSLDLKATETTLYADPTRINQVFWNLLHNAIKFTPRNGRVTVHSRIAGQGQIQVAIEDNGDGMDPDQVTRLFQPFVQVRDGYRKGLGLGLAIAKAIVEGHGGSIEARSDGNGKGSTFAVALPLAGPDTVTDA